MRALNKPFLGRVHLVRGSDRFAVCGVRLMASTLTARHLPGTGPAGGNVDPAQLCKTCLKFRHVKQ